MLTKGDCMKELDTFIEEFNQCRPILTAVGDQTRQTIILVMIENCGKGELRVDELSKLASISRTALSHHLKILRQTGVIEMREEGTKNFYYLDMKSSSLKEMIKFWNHVEPMMNLCKLKGVKQDEKD